MNLHDPFCVRQSVLLVLLEYGAVRADECEVPTSAAGCSAVDGPMVGAKCVFPFTFYGKNYCGCNADYVETEGIWCSTRQGSPLYVEVRSKELLAPSLLCYKELRNTIGHPKTFETKRAKM